MLVRRLSVLALSFVCLQLLCADARAQANPPMREEVLPPYANKFPSPAQDIPAPIPRADVGRPRQSLTKEEERLLAVPREDRETYAGLLKGSRGGLVRLLPRETFDGKLELRGGGAYYSFVFREHQYGYGSDIELQSGQFSVGFAGADFGFLIDLGDTPLEWVTTETDAVRFMADFETPADELDARAVQGQMFSRRGQQEGPWTYYSKLPAVVGHTYALRSINYNYSDVLVAFRALRQDENGSVLLLWRTLKEYTPPVLRRDTATRR
jgi:hypothetical protein